MTIEEAENWIRLYEYGIDDDLFRVSSNLSIVMRLMLHSHIKKSKICRLTVDDYNNRDFGVTEDDDSIVKKHIRDNRLNPNDLIIQVSDRALRYKFNNVINVYYGGGRRPELADLYYAGIGQENRPMNRYLF